MSNVMTLPVGNLAIAASIGGASNKPALILLHGWPHSRALYGDVVDELGRDFFVLAMDLPTVGDSRGTASAEKIALADIVLSAAEGAGAHDITIAGLDVGGMIAFAAARDHGRRLSRAIIMNTVIPGIEPWTQVLTDPHIWHFAFHNVAHLPELLVRGHERAYFDFFHDVLAGDPKRIPDALRHAFAGAYSRPEALKAGFDWYRAMEVDAKRNASKTAITTPLLYVRGDADGRSIDPYVEGLKSAGALSLTGRVVAGAGELLPLEAPRAFVDLVRDFAS
jgi:pimeloyl-ACP methyl ester carboxylesterase